VTAARRIRTFPCSITPKILRLAAVLLFCGCVSGYGRQPGAVLAAGGQGPLAVHVAAFPEGGAANPIWTRTLIAWPEAPVFLFDGRDFVIRLWAVPSGSAAAVYTEKGGVLETAAPPPPVPPKTVKLGETFTIKAGAARFQVTVERM